MKMSKTEENKPIVILVIGVLAFVMAVCFAQNQPTNLAQETLDFMNSPQGTGVVKKVQFLVTASYGKIGVSNELVRVSTDITFAVPIRQFASEALQTYDKSATNTYEEIVAFFKAWTFAEEPPMTTNTILVMKRSLEIGSSAFVQLQSLQSDTNIPALYRQYIGEAVTNILSGTAH